MLKKKPFEIIVKLLKQRLENLNDKNNRVIKLFIKLYKNIKIPLELNNNNKKILKNNNQASKFNANKFIVSNMCNSIAYNKIKIIIKSLDKRFYCLPSKGKW
jgi:hypothetical protein